MFYTWRALGYLFLISISEAAQNEHDHPAPEKLGVVSFPISCRPSVQQDFNRAVALLHSFAYSPAEKAFRRVANEDPSCAIAHWGVAITHFHPLWEPSLPSSTILLAREELQRARAMGASNERERDFIQALEFIFQTDAPYPARLSQYESAMCQLAAQQRADTEAQVFCALAVLANASPRDRSFAKQKKAAGILEPLFRVYPQHPGIPHYLIHAYDNAELASRGLIAARAYAQIAPSAPHALHMPSHIFTRLGLWDDSIASNQAARDAARRLGDAGEELHAMDYLVYAYLQAGRDPEAAQVLQQLRALPSLKLEDFKIGYAATAMPIRCAVERELWTEAARLVPPFKAPPHVVAIAVWARGLGLARTGHGEEARAEADKLRLLKEQLLQSGNEYWALQTSVLAHEVEAWSAQAVNQRQRAITLLRQAAEEEDASEKLPVTPGPIVPGREQLAYLLLEQNRPCLAQKEFERALSSAPGRRGALKGALRAAALCSRNE